MRARGKQRSSPDPWTQLLSGFGRNKTEAAAADFVARCLASVLSLEGVEVYSATTPRKAPRVLAVYPKNSELRCESIAKQVITSQRAVGRAMGLNPAPVIIPCHRVVAADGTLGGFGGGLSLKRWLLAHEAGQTRLGLEPGLFEDIEDAENE